MFLGTLIGWSRSNQPKGPIGKSAFLEWITELGRYYQSDRDVATQAIGYRGLPTIYLTTFSFSAGNTRYAPPLCKTSTEVSF